GGWERPFVEQRLDVHHRSADDDRDRAAAGDRLDIAGRGLLIARDGRRLGYFENVELVVRDAATLGYRQLRSADVHAAVELHGVGVHDLTADVFGDGQRERGLAGAGWADDRDRSCHGCQTPAK